MSAAKKRVGVGIAATVGAAVLWGSSFSVNDIGLHHVGPGTFALLRFTVAALVTLPFVLLWRKRNGLKLTLGFGRACGHALAETCGCGAKPPRPPFWFVALCLANALAFLLQYFAQTMTTPARTALFVNTSAFTVAIIERILYRRSLGWKRWLAVALGFLGAAILIVGGDPSELLRARFLGDLLAMLAGFVWAVYFVMNDRAVEKEDVVHLTAWTFAGTAIVLLGAPLLDPLLSTSETTGIDRTGALAILYSGIVTTALAFGLWAYGLTRIRASVSAVLLMVEILVASIVSVALGREAFGAVELVGAAVLVTAVFLASAVARTDA